MVWCQSDRLRSDGFPTTYHHDHHDYHHDHDIVMKSDYGLELEYLIFTITEKGHVCLYIGWYAES